MPKTISRCFTPVRGKAMRVTELDGCGAPILGDNTSVVSKGFVTISVTANVEDGEEINVTNAAGERCVYEPACPTLLGFEVEIEFCRVDPALFAILTGQEPIIDPDTGDIIGFKVCTTKSACDSGFALEVWTGSPGTKCDPSQVGGQAGGYILFPFLQGGTFGDFTIENAEITFTVQGAATKDGSAWGTGPHPVEYDPETASYGPLRSTSVTDCDHLVVTQTTTPPPTAYCGPVPTLNPTDDPVVSLTTAPGATENSVLFEPTPASADPFWVDFGDGEWDYSEDGSALEHEYASRGTYTVTIYRGATMVSTDITVPLGGQSS